MTEESAGIARTYEQQMTRNEEGVYLSLGETGEQYVFERQESGKYLMYQYDPVSGEFITPMLPEGVKQQIENRVMTLDMVCVESSVVDGYLARVTAYFDFYESLRSDAMFQGLEKIDGVECRCYTAEYDGETGTRTVTCTQFTEENVSFPNYL